MSKTTNRFSTEVRGRAALMAVKVLPVFERTNFGPIEIIPDWARKQQVRYGLMEPLSIG